MEELLPLPPYGRMPPNAISGNTSIMPAENLLYDSLHRWGPTPFAKDRGSFGKKRATKNAGLISAGLRPQEANFLTAFCQ